MSSPLSPQAFSAALAAQVARLTQAESHRACSQCGHPVSIAEALGLLGNLGAQRSVRVTARTESGELVRLVLPLFGPINPMTMLIEADQETRE